MKNTAKFAIVAASVAGGLAFVAAPAVAAEPVVMAGAHCVANADNGKFACADTEEEAMRLADVDPRAVTAVRLYDGKDFTGDSVPVKTARACTDGYEHEFIYPDLRGTGWNDRASSVRTYRNCDVKLYDVAPAPDDPNLSKGSTWIHESDDLAEIGDGWNNRASSMRIS